MIEIFESDPVLHQLFKDGLTAREVPKDAEGNYVQGGLMQARPRTMRLMGLTLENFRAFRGETKFDFQGRNALIYGENGSGKTSIWSALDLFLGATLASDEAKSRTDFGKNRYQFNRQPGRVEFEVLDEFGQYLPEAVWSREDTPFEHPDIMAGARVSACLDYRSLWETYFLHRKKKTVDIWPLLIETLIPHVTTFRGPTLEDTWKQLKGEFAQVDFVEEADENLEDSEEEIDGDQLMKQVDVTRSRASIMLLHAELEQVLKAIKETADSILLRLSPGLTFDWDIRPAKQSLQSNTNTLILHPPKVIVSVQLPEERKLSNHHNLLNEARLSALALSIYLAAAKTNAAQARSGFKILALDDVLIGLDMSNRIPILGILETDFNDWQVFLFTYDRAWYEIAAMRLKNSTWKKFEFYASDDVPVWCESQDALAKSRTFLSTAHALLVPDYKAAAVYARSAFEWMMKWFCDEYGLPVSYDLEGLQNSEVFWKTVQSIYLEGYNEGSPTKSDLISQTLKEKVIRDRKVILNPLAHATLTPIYPQEVQDAIETVRELYEILHPVNGFDGKIKTTLISEEPIDFKTCSAAKLNAIFHQARKEKELREAVVTE